MGGRVGWGVEFVCPDLDTVLWVGESLRNFIYLEERTEARGGYGMMVKWQRDEPMHGLGPAIDWMGCWRVGASDGYH